MLSIICTLHFSSQSVFWMPTRKGYGASRASIMFAGKLVIKVKCHLKGWIRVIRVCMMMAMSEVSCSIMIIFFSSSRLRMSCRITSKFGIFSNSNWKLKSSILNSLLLW